MRNWEGQEAERRSVEQPLANRPTAEGDQATQTFFVLGDWGRQGEFNQTEVAEQMAAQARTYKPAFVVNTGDNFYPGGLFSVDDPNFDDSFRNVYDAPELQVPFHGVLGNHDYGDGQDPRIREECKVLTGADCGRDCCYSPLHQLDATLWKQDARWHMQRSKTLPLAGGMLDLFFYDTPPFVAEYRTHAWSEYPGGLASQSWAAGLRELESALAQSEAAWKVVIGHHPVRSNGMHGDTMELREHVEPLLEKYGVQLYLCGHDHLLEHIHKEGGLTHFIVSGGGSQTRSGFSSKLDSIFQYDASGFVAVSVSNTEITADFFGIESEQPLHTAHIPLHHLHALTSMRRGEAVDSM
ncbi:hypothetical protein WJX72_012198 [[Myrmecia] bisecta]|uniref:Purple acid phosphatase n=1 Tax=[Myrmecia] bisecta TaxID=41462 RepID=A0AAW1PJ54_9CHLO